MKSFFLTIIFIGLAVYLGYELYERYQNQEPQGGDAESDASGGGFSYRYPEEIEIVRLDGSRLDVRLTGRNPTHIQFERLADGVSFTYEIAQLDAATRKRVMRYPDSGLSNIDELVRSGALSLETAYLEQLREALAKIDAGIRDRQRKAGNSSSKTERLTLRREVEALEAERKLLEAKIAERSGG